MSKERELQELIERIGELDAEAMTAAQHRQDELTKPRGSLGVLEQLSIRLAGITGRPVNELNKKAVVVMAGDHGITSEGVSAYPSEVTAQMVLNFVGGGAAINVLAKHGGVDVCVVDMGVMTDIKNERVMVKKVRSGTGNITCGPAMSRQEAIESILGGAEVAAGLIEDGVSIIATGDMGIGNTSASSALVSVLGGLSVEDVVGSGTGVNSEGLLLKKAAIKKAIEINKANKADAVDVLAKLGGLEIAGLAGVVLRSAANRCPVVIDGFISSAAALVAAKLAPKAVHYMIASHLSVEPGHKLALAEVGLSPMIHMDMRLGEGTGAVLAMNLVDAAAKIIGEMATFAQAGVSEGEEDQQAIVNQSPAERKV